jgi:hypothetical protein
MKSWAHILADRKGVDVMYAQNKNRGSRISRAFAIFGAAVSASAAVENHRRPKNSDLTILGIDPKAFDRIG